MEPACRSAIVTKMFAIDYVVRILVDEAVLMIDNIDVLC